MGLLKPDREMLLRSLGERKGRKWVDRILQRHLTPQERKILLLRLGLEGEPVTLSNIAAMMGVRTRRIQQLEKGAWSRIEDDLQRALGALQPPQLLLLTEALESVQRITPELLAYLRKRTQEVRCLPPNVFEQLFGELLAGVGWEEVRLVGRDFRTSADILAGHYCSSLGVRMRVFIETKRWRSRVGVEVFNKVLGAMSSERDTFGWHQAWIVALGGVATTRKFSPDQWRLKGVEVKDFTDVTRWLEGYRPNAHGLWLPSEALSVAT